MAKRKLTNSFIRKHKNPNKRIEIYDTLVNGLAIRITKAGSKSFVFRYRFRNKVKRYTMGRFPDIGLAKAWELFWQVSNEIDPLEKEERT